MRLLLRLAIPILFIFSCRPATDVQFLHEDDVQNFGKQLGINSKLQIQVDSVYKKFDNRILWISDNNLTAAGAGFIKRINSEIADSSYAPMMNSEIIQKFFQPDKKTLRNDSLIRLADFIYTTVFIDYAYQNWVADNELLNKSGWIIKDKKDPFHLLETFLNTDTIDYKNFNPVNIKVVQLKEALIRLEKLQKINTATPNFSSTTATGDLAEYIFKIGYSRSTSNPEETIKNFQLANGLEETGKLNEETIALLNTPTSEIINRIRINIERLKTLPQFLSGEQIAVNIPEYKMNIYKNDQLQWSCDVVVGTDSTSTVVFNDSMEMVVFSPTWTLPNSIIIKETAPSILKNPDYLKEHSMEVLNQKGEIIDENKIDWKNPEGGIMIRQKSGEGNSLGKIKFLFPNSHSIYFHDTPAKSLFNETDRAFSHGCIRVSQPVKLAQYVLSDQPEWTEEKIREAMDAGEEKTVRLKRKIPVYLLYLTTWIDDNGNLNVRKDIYGQDQRLSSNAKMKIAKAN